MTDAFDPVPRWLVVLLVPIVAGAAGCIGLGDSEAEGQQAFDGYEEALEASGIELGPVSGTGVTVELLEPGRQVDSPGSQPVVVLVHDASAGEPVRDAEVALQARMPAMGHGTGPESDPTHVGDGLYEGQTTWSMAGGWVLNLDVALADGSSASYSVEVTVGEHDEAPAQAPIEPYGSFDDVMAAPGTVYEGEIASPATANLTITDNVQEPAYERRESLELEDRPLVSLEIQGQLQASTDLAELNVTLIDPDGSPAASFLLKGGGSADGITLEAPSPGEWQVDVTGRGLEASYEVTVEAEYEHPHIDVKTLEPSDPSRTLPGERPFIFAVFEAFGPEPVEDAEVDVTFRAIGSQTGQQVDPSHEAHGQYQARADFQADESWVADIQVELPTGEAYRYEVDVTVEAP